MMGFGEFGSNGSVHWKIVHTGDAKLDGYVKGRDPNVPRAVELKHVKPTKYTVSLHMTKEELQKAAARAVERDGYVSFRVKASNPVRCDGPDVQWEIRIDW
jgi:hypothetical protein